jgi:hypothetical protein
LHCHGLQNNSPYLIFELNILSASESWRFFI